MFFRNGLGIEGKITVIAVNLFDIETRRSRGRTGKKVISSQFSG
jgi:hypothetical protein